MKTLGFIVSLVIFVIIGVLPFVTIYYLLPTPKTVLERTCYLYAGIFLTVNFLMAGYYADLFAKWFKSNLK